MRIFYVLFFIICSCNHVDIIECVDDPKVDSCIYAQISNYCTDVLIDDGYPEDTFFDYNYYYDNYQKVIEDEKCEIEMKTSVINFMTYVHYDEIWTCRRWTLANKCFENLK